MLEEIGRNLTPSPFLTTAVAAVRALEGSAQAERWFPGILAGETVAALAIDEGKHHDPAAIAMEAKRSGQRLRPQRAPSSSSSTAPAPTSSWSRRAPAGRPAKREGLTLFAVEKGASGPRRRQCRAGRQQQGGAADASTMSRSMPTRWSARSTAAGRRLSRALNAGRAGAAAELVGVAAGASEMTFDYLKQRKQFGKLIGEFQALQHRAAHLYGEIEIARAAALKAAQLLDAGDAARRAVGLGRQGQGGRVAGARGPGRRADARRHRHDRRA